MSPLGSISTPPTVAALPLAIGVMTTPPVPNEVSSVPSTLKRAIPKAGLPLAGSVTLPATTVLPSDCTATLLVVSLPLALPGWA